MRINIFNTQSRIFWEAAGKYYDNDQGRFASPHPDALDNRKNEQLVEAVEAVLLEISV
jgi:hypothetical protein